MQERVRLVERVLDLAGLEPAARPPTISQPLAEPIPASEGVRRN
jgi:hypothetical protein